MAALFRLATYTGDTDRMSAGAALAQLQLATKHSVLYLDDGWRTLVDGLHRAATAAGAKILTGAKAASVDTTGHSVNSVTLADGTKIQARAAILAVNPAAASALVPASADLAAYARDLVPVPVACLDVALASLPDRRSLFALGVDRPLYASVHSASARLAPAGGAVVQLLHYLPSGDARRRGRARRAPRSPPARVARGPRRNASSRRSSPPTPSSPPARGGLANAPATRSPASPASTSRATGSAPPACSPTPRSPARASPRASPRRTCRSRAPREPRRRRALPRARAPPPRPLIPAHRKRGGRR